MCNAAERPKSLSKLRIADGESSAKLCVKDSFYEKY